MLGQLGGAQQQADIARMGLQNQLGQQQQQYQQGIINQAIQDYATQQQYPMIQLSNISNLLRGLPMQAGTTQMYQAAPSQLSQLGGLAATGLGVYGASGGFRAAKGGEVKSYAAGGVVGGVEAQLMQMEIPQLQQVAKTSPSVSIREKAAEIIAQKQMAMQTKQSMGIDSLPAGNLDDIGMAGGGIVAFSGKDESLVKEPEFGTPEYDEKYGAPGSLKRKFKSVRDYYASPSSEAGVARNVSNTINAVAPMTFGAGITGGQFIPKTGGVVTNATDRIRKLIGIQGNINAMGSGSGALPVPGNVVAEAAPVDNAPASGAPAAGAPGSGAPAGSAGAGGKYETEIQEMIADLRKGLGEGRAQKDLDALREEMRGNKDQNLWMSLIQGGAKAMQSTSPHAMVGLGAGLEAGAKEYGRGMEGERADKKLLLAQQSALEQAEYARKSGNLNALIAAQTRLDNVSAQRENLAAQREIATLSSRDKAYGDLVYKFFVQTQNMDEAKKLANEAYAGTNLGGMPGGSATAPSAIPKKGDVRAGYRYNGGNPNDKNNWSKV
jgi:hypothetical protein